MHLHIHLQLVLSLAAGVGSEEVLEEVSVEVSAKPKETGWVGKSKDRGKMPKV